MKTHSMPMSLRRRPQAFDRPMPQEIVLDKATPPCPLRAEYYIEKSRVIPSKHNGDKAPTHAIIWCHGRSDAVKGNRADKIMERYNNMFDDNSVQNGERSPFSLIFATTQSLRRRKRYKTLLKELKDQGYESFSIASFSSGGATAQKILQASSGISDVAGGDVPQEKKESLPCKGGVFLAPVHKTKAQIFSKENGKESWSHKFVNFLISCGGGQYLVKNQKNKSAKAPKPQSEEAGNISTFQVTYHPKDNLIRRGWAEPVSGIDAGCQYEEEMSQAFGNADYKRLSMLRCRKTPHEEPLHDFISLTGQKLDALDGYTEEQRKAFEDLRQRLNPKIKEDKRAVEGEPA